MSASSFTLAWYWGPSQNVTIMLENCSLSGKTTTFDTVSMFHASYIMNVLIQFNLFIILMHFCCQYSGLYLENRCFIHLFQTNTGYITFNFKRTLELFPALPQKIRWALHENEEQNCFDWQRSLYIIHSMLLKQSERRFCTHRCLIFLRVLCVPINNRFISYKIYVVDTALCQTPAPLSIQSLNLFS